MKRIEPPTNTTVTHCHGYGCMHKQAIDLPNQTQTALSTLFKKAPKTAKEERQRIIKAIQIFEQDIGKLNQTDTDKGGTFRFLTDEKAQGKQLDCVDESTNTTNYLTYLENKGYLAFHTTVFPVSKQPFLNGARWWHQSASIIENETGERFAVDSWYNDNGEAPYILPYALWKKGRAPSWISNIKHGQTA